MKCPHCNGTGEMAATFGALVLKARREKGLTQAELAAATGVTRPHIANIETDRTDVPLTTLLRLAQALGVPAQQLIPLVTPAPPGPADFRAAAGVGLPQPGPSQ